MDDALRPDLTAAWHFVIEFQLLTSVNVRLVAPGYIEAIIARVCVWPLATIYVGIHFELIQSVTLYRFMLPI